MRKSFRPVINAASSSPHVADVVVGRQPLVWAERLLLDRVQSFGNHIGAGNVPARGETRLVEHERGMGVRDELVALPHDEVTEAASDVDPVIRVGGVARMRSSSS